MIKRIGHFINIILLSLAVLTIGSCDRHGTAWNEMDKAENLMDAKPDSALVVLENIPASSVKGKEAAADIENVWKDIKNELYYGLTDEEIASFQKTFRKICKNIEHFMM